MSSSLYQRPAAGGAAARHEEPSLSHQEAENNAILEALLRDTKTLHSAAKTVSKEVKSHNDILERLQDHAQRAKATLQRTLGRLSTVEGTHSVKHLWLLFAVAFGVFFFIYLLLKFKR